MALVQGTHGRHQHDRPAVLARGTQQAAPAPPGCRRAGEVRSLAGQPLAGRGARCGRRGRPGGVGGLGGLEHLAELGAADGQQPAVGDDAAEGRPGQRDVRRQRLGGVAGDLGEVAADGLDVATDDRAGEGGVAVGQRVVEGGGEQRAQGAGRVVDAGRRQQLGGLGDEGDQVVGAVGQRRVVERAASSGTQIGRPPMSTTSCSASARSSAPAVTPKTQPSSRSRSTAVPVKVIAGWSASGRAPTSTAGASTARPCRPQVWTTT